MIKVSRIKLGLIKSRAQYILDFSVQGDIKAVAEAIVKEVEEAERREEVEWNSMKEEIKQGGVVRL